MTLKEVIESCFEARKAELKGDGAAGRWMSPLTLHIIPKLGSYPIEQIDQHVLKEVLAPIWHKKADTAEKALNRISLALKHAAALGMGVDLQATMKARALLGRQRHTVTHIPSMPYEEAPAFYRWLVGQDGVAALALRFLILTVARTSEIRLANLSEIESGIWTLPAVRTKTGKARRIPLSCEARSIVRHCKTVHAGDHLFPAHRGQPISDMAMSAFMRCRNIAFRPHGFRATFRTWVEEQTNAPFEVKESCLGHVVDTGVVGAYQRSDRFEKRRALLEQWERFLLEYEEA